MRLAIESHFNRHGQRILVSAVALGTQSLGERDQAVCEPPSVSCLIGVNNPAVWLNFGSEYEPALPHLV
jgi:hypothetical protein